MAPVEPEKTVAEKQLRRRVGGDPCPIAEDSKRGIAFEGCCVYVCVRIFPRLRVIAVEPDWAVCGVQYCDCDYYPLLRLG